MTQATQAHSFFMTAPTDTDLTECQISKGLEVEKLMALKPVDLTSIPKEKARVAKAAFPKGNIYFKLRNELGALYQDDTFSHLFSSAGCPAESPGRLEMITVFQFAVGLLDRAAADAVRSRLDWKYALGLELTDPGFVATVLVEFRIRFNASDQARLLFETLLERLREAKLVKARGRQRTDSTRVRAGVHVYNWLECVWEASNIFITVASQARMKR